jgi:hypothetical protein
MGICTVTVESGMPTYYYFEILLTNSTTGSLPLHHSADSEAWVCGPAYYMYIIYLHRADHSAVPVVPRHLHHDTAGVIVRGRWSDVLTLRHHRRHQASKLCI